MSIEKQPAKWVEKALRFSIRTYIESRSKIEIERNDTIDLKPPYIILSNHTNNWDPLFINCYVGETMSFIAGDSLFRNPVLGRILDYTGAIPKAKFRNDTNTIRNIIKAKKHNRVIGLFPEGNRNWDGTTEPIIFSTAKLVRALDIPVVIATIRGGYLSHPRWANTHRRGLISISYKKLWDKGELKNESPETIHQKLTEALAHNEMEWQFKKQTPYKGKELAHYLERLLFLCPHCEKVGDLHSDDDLFQCNHCQYKVKCTTLGNFKQVNHELIYATSQEWNKWQLGFLKTTLLNSNSKRQYSIKDHVKLYVVDENKPFRLISSGNITWSFPSEKMIFQGDNGEQSEFVLEKMDGLNIHLHHNLDYFYEGKVYRLEFYQPRTSAYKWLKSIQIALLARNKGVIS